MPGGELASMLVGGNRTIRGPGTSRYGNANKISHILHGICWLISVAFFTNRLEDISTKRQGILMGFCLLERTKPELTNAGYFNIILCVPLNGLFPWATKA